MEDVKLQKKPEYYYFHLGGARNHVCIAPRVSFTHWHPGWKLLNFQINSRSFSALNYHVR